MIARRLAPDLAITSAKRRCLAGRSPAASISAITITPFIGVRISWLMVARKSLLATLAASAASLASFRSAVRSATVRSKPAAWAASLASRPRISASMSLKPATRSPTSSSATTSAERL